MNHLTAVSALLNSTDNQGLALFKLQDKQALSNAIPMQKHAFHYFSSQPNFLILRHTKQQKSGPPHQNQVTQT